MRYSYAFFHFSIHPPPKLLPVWGPLERYMTPTLDAALLFNYTLYHSLHVLTYITSFLYLSIPCNEFSSCYNHTKLLRVANMQLLIKCYNRKKVNSPDDLTTGYVV